jgi:hypothetical protein
VRTAEIRSFTVQIRRAGAWNVNPSWSGMDIEGSVTQRAVAP